VASIAFPYEQTADEAAGVDLARDLAVGPVDDLPRIFVVPALDEEENLPRLLRDLEARPQLFPEGSRLIVVDDGSTDGTAGVVLDYEGPLAVELLPLGENLGPGAAFRAGFAAALDRCPGDGYVVTLEADTTSDLDALPAMLAHAAGGADLVLASVHGGGQMLNVSPLRRLLSVAAGKVVRVCLGLDARTVSSFFRVYRLSTLRRAHDRYGESLIQESGFACKAELLSKIAALGARVEEVPVDLDGSRRVGASKMSLLPTLGGYVRLIVRGRFTRGIASA
jgi:dolichol-phosphate mannosyltransferase